MLNLTFTRLILNLYKFGVDFCLEEFCKSKVISGVHVLFSPNNCNCIHLFISPVYKQRSFLKGRKLETEYSQIADFFDF